MTYPNARGAMHQYGTAGIEAAIMNASPHRLIQMLMEGALEKMAIAKGAVERGEFARKSQYISWAVSIVNGLRMSLNKEAGGQIAANLDALYDYMARRLMEANSKNDAAMVEEVAGLLRQIKEGWDGIAEQVDQSPKRTEGAAHISIGV